MGGDFLKVDFDEVEFLVVELVHIFKEFLVGVKFGLDLAQQVSINV